MNDYSYPLSGQAFTYDSLAESVCPARNVYIPDRLSSTCYRMHIETQTTWIGARDACAASGEMLVVLEPVTKAYFMTDFFTVNTSK